MPGAAAASSASATAPSRSSNASWRSSSGALLGLLVVDRPAQLADEMFQAAVGIGEQLHRRAKLVVGRLLRLEDRPVSGRQRLEIDRLEAALHD